MPSKATSKKATATTAKATGKKAPALPRGGPQVKGQKGLAPQFPKAVTGDKKMGKK